MIKEISYSLKGGQFGATTQNSSNKNLNKAKNISLPMSNPEQVFTYSSRNLKANFMPFKSKLAISFCAKQEGVDCRKPFPVVSKPVVGPQITSGVKNITSLPKEDLIQGGLYEKTADDVSILMGTGKNNVVLFKEEGSSPEILADTFAMKIQDKKNLLQGFDPKNTSVHYIDFDNLKIHPFPENMEGFVNILTTKIFVPEDGKKRIVFFDNFEKYVSMLKNPDLNQVLKEQFPNTTVIGFIPKPKSVDKPPAYLENLTSMPKLDFNGLTPKEAQKFFDENHDVVMNLLMKYDNAYVEIPDNTIKRAIERSRSIQGALPGSAVKILDLAVASVITKPEAFKKANQKVDVKPQHVDELLEHSAIFSHMKPNTGKFHMMDNVNTSFADIGGLSDANKREAQKIIDYLKNPEEYIAKYKKAPKGFIMSSDPGMGKTLLARVIAGESRAPFFSASGSDFVERYVGVGASRVRDLFENARKNAPSVVFIDEIDAVGKARNAGGSAGADEREATLNQLLVEMDGINNPKSGVVVMAASNRPDILDPALVRPGRFDSEFKIKGPKSVSQREEILHVHARKLPFVSPQEKEKIISEVAKITEGMSGAELMNVMNKASNFVFDRGGDSRITYDDVVEGVLQTFAGAVDSSSEATLEERKMVVRHEAGHAVLFDMLKRDKISFITLDPRGSFLGAVFHHKGGGNSHHDFRSIIYSVASSYAGGLAEPGFAKNGHKSGVSGDLEHVTNLINNAVEEWDLGVNSPHLNLKLVEDPTLKALGTKDKLLMSKTAHNLAQRVLQFHQGFLDEYMEKYEANAGKGGNNLSGEAFSQLRQDWLKRTEKVEAEAKLIADNDKLITEALESSKSFISRLARKVVRYSERFNLGSKTLKMIR